MNAAMYKRLKQVTPEEERILNGDPNVQWDIYSDADISRCKGNYIIDYGKFVDPDMRISVRKHTRFVYFPPHTHNYVEIFYVYSGSVTHIIDGKKIVVKSGEFLIMSQYMSHSILPCGENDIAINIIVMPSFLKQISDNIGTDNILAELFINILEENNGEGAQPYFYFPVRDNLCIQNVVDNIFYAVMFRKDNLEPILMKALELLFLYLISDAEQLYANRNEDRDNLLIMTVRRYISDEYQNGTLQDLADRTRYSVSTLSRLIKKYTGSTFKKLQSDQRMQAAMELLLMTDLPISEIATTVGYENQSFFYKRFQAEFNETPNEIRKRLKKVRPAK